ncbi:MAG: hypothetical protein IIV45_11675 [Lachnospiraceae bacterium]|nr:hypothetical protein [Lachnospiraceae bacterium]
MAKQYIEPQKRYEDHKSTGILFLVIGFIGTVITVLCWMRIIKFPLNSFQLLILLAMFVAFMGFGAFSLKRASEVFQTIESENNQVANMRKWIEENRENFCVSDTAGLSGSEIYFQREQDIHDAILVQYPEIEESLLDIFVEETYQALFEQM